MPAAQRQLAPRDPADWIGVDEAASLTGVTSRAWQLRCKHKLASTGLAELRTPPHGGKPVWYISRAVDARLSRCVDRETRDARDRAALVTRHPEHIVERASRKLYWVRRWRKACLVATRGRTEKQVAADVVVEAKRAEGHDCRISVRSLYAWRSAYDGGDGGGPRGLEALIDRYTSSTSDSATAVASLARSPEAVEYFYSLYHAPAKHTAKTCHVATIERSKVERWNWPASYSATARWLRENDDRALTCLHRDGRTEYSRRFMGYVETECGGIEPGSRYVLDHTRADFWVRHRGELIRPWFTAVIDERSRCLVGWTLGVSPNQDQIAAAVRMAFSEWGLPEHVHVDRGSDFLSELLVGFTKAEKRRLRKEHGADWRTMFRHQLDVHWLGIFGELGIQVAEAMPRHPWAKGKVERVFRRWEDEHGKTYFTYWGNKPEARPECAEELRHADDVPTLDDARSRFADWLTVYHNSAHQGQGMDGKSPIEVWRTAATIRKAAEGELLALMQGRGVYRVGPNGVSFRACGKTLCYGQYHPELLRRRGRDVFVTVDPADWSCCHAYDLGSHGRKKYIGRLQSNERIPKDTDTENLREAIRNVRRREKVMGRAAVEAPKRQRNAAAELAAMEAAEAKRLRATGTDDHRPNVRMVQTGFSTAVRTVHEGISGGGTARGSARAGGRALDDARPVTGPVDLAALFDGDEEDDGPGISVVPMTADQLYGEEEIEATERPMLEDVL